MTASFVQTTTYNVICCPADGCGMHFAITGEYESRRRDDHRKFYCPNGHSMSYGTSDLERQLEQQKAATRRLERVVANRDEDLRSAKAAHAVTKGKLTKTRNRIKNGVCPCCNRSFVDLHRHMTNKHPDYAEASKA